MLLAVGRFEIELIEVEGESILNPLDVSNSVGLRILCGLEFNVEQLSPKLVGDRLIERNSKTFIKFKKKIFIK
jgi:hypothetical protein